MRLFPRLWPVEFAPAKEPEKVVTAVWQDGRPVYIGAAQEMINLQTGRD